MRSEGALRRLGSALVAPALLVCLSGCGLQMQTDGGTKPAFPPGPSFDHASHLEKGLECEDCHEGLADDEEPGLPDFDFCLECHEEMDEERPVEERVSTMWLDEDGEPRWHRVTAQEGDVLFSHGPHLARSIACATCHTGIEESRQVGFDLRQEMNDCITCHTKRDAPTSCDTCHEDIDGDWKPPTHDRMWMTLHGQRIQEGGAPERVTDDCSLCHTQTTCAECHRTRPPRDHSQSWRRGGGHGLSASMDRQRCQACHEVHDCIACHQNARPRSHNGMWGGRRARHCLSCHEPLRPDSPDGCGVCHQGTPSHDRAPPKPGWHTPDLDCLVCHAPLRHADNGRDCNSCHR